MLRPPTRIAPAASSLRTSAPSRLAAGPSALIFEPARVGRPAMSNRFFTANGTPLIGPMCRPASISAARFFARSATMSVKALTVGSAALMRARAAATTALAFTLPVLTARAISAAVAAFDRGSFTGDRSWTKDRRGREVVVELHGQQRLRNGERALDVQDDVRAVFRRDRQADRQRCLVDPFRYVGLLFCHWFLPHSIWPKRKEHAKHHASGWLQSPRRFARKDHDQRSRSRSPLTARRLSRRHAHVA